MNKIYRVVRNSTTGECKVASELASARGKRNRLSRAVASTLFLAAPMLGIAAAAGAAPLAELSGSNGILWYGAGCDTITVPSTCANETRTSQPDASGAALVFPNHLLVGANLSNTNTGPAVSGNLSITGGATVNSTRLYVGYEGNTTGTVTVSGEGSRWNGGGTMSVGNYGSGTMTLSDGGYARGSNIYVGNFEGGSGDLLVSGISAGGMRSTLEAGSTLFVGNNNDYVDGQPIPTAGDGVVTLADGGLVRTVNGFIGGRSGTGTMTVQGVNANGQASQWSMTGDLLLGSDGEGALSIIDGGQVSNANAYVGYYGAGGGTVNVGNGGQWNNSAALNIGFLTEGEMNIDAGGTVHSANATVGGYAGSAGRANVNGAGALWQNDGDLSIGNGGTGTIEINNGGKVSVGGSSYIGNGTGSSGTVIVSGADSQLTTYNLITGVSGHGTLQVTDGGKARSVGAVIGQDAGSDGQVQVSGAGSTWQNTNSTLVVGDAGQGTLSVSDGGLVDNQSYSTILTVGNKAGSHGTITVDGAGAQLKSNNGLVVGSDGQADVTVSNGGVLTNGFYTTMARSAGSSAHINVDGAGSRFDNTGFITVGLAGEASVDITNGGVMTTSSATIGGGAAGAGRVTVSGTGSLWHAKSSLSIGQFGSGELRIENGAQVDNTSASIGQYTDSHGDVTVTGADSQWNNTGDVIVGGLGTGTLTLAEGAHVIAPTMTLANQADATGTLNIGNGGLAGTLDTASITGGDGAASVNFDHTDDIDFAPVLSGSLSVNKSGAGTTTLSAVNDYAGATSVQSGTLRAGLANAFSAASDYTVDTGANLALNGFDQRLASLDNGGTVAFHDVDTTAGTTLTVAGNYVGNGGTLLMNTVLGDDTSATDKLVVEGNTSGNSYVRVRNAGGAGAATDNGIELIHVGGASDGVFELQGRAVAGLYDYQLHQGGRNTPDDGSWYLRSEVVPTPPVDPVDPVDPIDPVDPVTPPVDPVDPVDPVTPPVDPIDPVTPPVQPEQPDVPTPVLRPEPAAYLGNQVAALRMFQNTMHDRVGEPGLGVPDDGKGFTTWSRVQSHKLDAGTVGGQIDIDTTAHVVQMGVEKQFAVGDGRIHAGVMGGYGRATTDASSTVTDHQARGEVKGRNLGVYGTWFQNADGPEGLYVDAAAQYGTFSNTVKGDYLGREEYDSRVRTASVEAGYSFKMHEGERAGVYIEPQAQVIHSDFSSDDVHEQNGTLVQSRNAGGTTTRLGARLYTRPLNSEHNRVQPFVAVNWWSGGNAATIAMDGENLSRDLPKDTYEVKAGAQLELGKGWSGFGQLSHQSGSGGFRDVGAQVGVKLSW